MAEERNVGLQRAPEAGGEADATKAELQRRMEEARESITQTVTEIKESVVNQYQQVRETINDSLDWREQYRRRPVPFTVGALGVGLCLGYAVGGAFAGRDDEEDYENDLDDAGAFGRIESGFDRMSQSPRPYVASPTLAGAAGSSARRAKPAAAYAAGAPSAAEHAPEDVGPDPRPSYSSGYQAQTAPSPEASFAGLTSAAAGDESSPAAEEPKGPSVFARFKETKAYDRLQEELSTLGDRAVEELSRTARTVVLPALLAKVKDMLGLDLSAQREVAQRTRLEQQTAQAASSTAKADEDAASAGQNPGGTAAYATGGQSS